MKHQEDASDRKNDEEEKRDPPETKSITEAKAMGFHLHGKDMKEEVVKHQHGSFQIRIWYSSSENGPPH
jgi:hypothetical protein